jgi:hypothetical protein
LRLPPNRVAIPHLLHGNGVRKLLYKFEGDPTVGSKVTALSTGTLV